jgi:hypothetical protein
VVRAKRSPDSQFFVYKHVLVGQALALAISDLGVRPRESVCVSFSDMRR